MIIRKKKYKQTPMNIYLQKSHDFAKKQAIEKLLFEHQIEEELFDKTSELDIKYIKENLTGNEVFTDKEYLEILKSAKKILQEE